MTRRTLLSGAIVATVCISVGVWIGSWIAPQQNGSTPGMQLTCRPSLPERAVTQAALPAILFFGNSLLFDNDWRIPDALAVNCARQGMSASRARDLIENLPEVRPLGIVLAFGSVEAYHAQHNGKMINLAQFTADTEQINRSLRARWPDAWILWMPIPTTETAPGQLSPIRLSDAQTLNTALTVLAKQDARTLALSPQAAGHDEDGFVLYDGVHLSAPAYKIWETRLSQIFRAQFD